MIFGTAVCCIVLAAAGRAGPELSEQDGRLVAQALRGEKVSARTAWGEQQAIEAIAAGDRSRALAVALEDGRISPKVIWELDAAALRLAARLAPSDPDRAVLERGVATRVFRILAEQAAAQKCSAFGALGRMMAQADGEYAEALDETFALLFLESSGAVERCWSHLKPFASAIDLGSTDVCSDPRPLLGANGRNPEIAAFLREKLDKCSDVGGR